MYKVILILITFLIIIFIIDFSCKREQTEKFSTNDYIIIVKNQEIELVELVRTINASKTNYISRANLIKNSSITQEKQQTLTDLITVINFWIPVFVDNINNKERINFIKTLVHEYIHISQRYKGDIWVTHILENTNWIKDVELLLLVILIITLPQLILI